MKQQIGAAALSSSSAVLRATVHSSHIVPPTAQGTKEVSAASGDSKGRTENSEALLRSSHRQYRPPLQRSLPLRCLLGYTTAECAREDVGAERGANAALSLGSDAAPREVCSFLTVNKATATLRALRRCSALHTGLASSDVPSHCHLSHGFPFCTLKL